MRTRFGPFTLDSQARQLFRDQEELHLSPKAFDLLCTLVAQAPNVIEKADLHARIWPGTHVVEGNLNVLIGEIRRVLGDQAQRPQFIRTVHGVGFAFSADLIDLGDRREAATLRCWVLSAHGTFRLSEGDNVIGRDPHCDIWLDASGVSRRHATIRVNGQAGDVTVQDLGSTNGTFVAERRLDGATGMKDGDVITVGSVELTIRVMTSDTLPETERIRR